MSKAITTLAKDIKTQNNEKFRLNSTKRMFDTQNTERRGANHNLQMVMAGFKSSVNVNNQSDSKALIDHLKAHMNATNSTPLVGQELVGVTPIREAHILVNYIIALDESILQML